MFSFCSHGVRRYEHAPFALDLCNGKLLFECRYCEFRDVLEAEEAYRRFGEHVTFEEANAAAICPRCQAKPEFIRLRIANPGDELGRPVYVKNGRRPKRGPANRLTRGSRYRPERD